MSSDNSAVEERTVDNSASESAQRMDPAETLEVAIAYCYLGSIVDDSTGEILDLYGLCDDGSMAENFDMA